MSEELQQRLRTQLWDVANTLYLEIATFTHFFPLLCP